MINQNKKNKSLKIQLDCVLFDYLPSIILGNFKKVYHFLFGHYTHWLRVVMDRTTTAYIQSLNFRDFHALEISGTQFSKWKTFGFATYRNISYPDYDICTEALNNETFDVIIAEQVLEHVLWPYRAVRNLYKMLKPGGILIVTTPFLYRIHNTPVDCSRWTELGLKHLLAEGGFNITKILTGSWGNKSSIVANFSITKNIYWIPWKHSLKNESLYPLVVWAFAQR